MTNPTKWLCAHRRLGSAWASAKSDQSSLCAQWVAKDPSFLHVDSEDSDQICGCPGWSESSLGAQIICWFYHNAAHIITSLLLTSLGEQYILMSIDWKEMSIWNVSQFRMKPMALSVWFNGCCPRQSLTGVSVTCKERLFDCMFHEQIRTLDFRTYRASLFLNMIKFVYKIWIKSLYVIKLQWWWWSVNFMNHILPLT